MAETHQIRLFEALKSKYEAEINEALYSLELMFLKPSSIGAHTKAIVKDADKALSKFSEAKGKLEDIIYYFENNNAFHLPTKDAPVSNYKTSKGNNIQIPHGFDFSSVPEGDPETRKIREENKDGKNKK